jgi:hypothetical protein
MQLGMQVRPPDRQVDQASHPILKLYMVDVSTYIQYIGIIITCREQNPDLESSVAPHLWAVSESDHRW